MQSEKINRKSMVAFSLFLSFNLHENTRVFLCGDSVTLGIKLTLYGESPAMDNITGGVI